MLIGTALSDAIIGSAHKFRTVSIIDFGLIWAGMLQSCLLLTSKPGVLPLRPAISQGLMQSASASSGMSELVFLLL